MNGLVSKSKHWGLIKLKPKVQEGLPYKMLRMFSDAQGPCDKA